MERAHYKIVTLAADVTIRSLQRGAFAGMRALGLAGYRWALPRLNSRFVFFLTVLHVLVNHQIGTFAGHMSFLSFLALLPTLSTTTNM